MALGANSIIDVRSGGSDTANGGSFNTGYSGSLTFPSDGAATVANTSSPVFSSASYNFVSGDVGAWLYIKSGSGWIPGWYQIASVSSNKATLTAGVGTAVLFFEGAPTGWNTVAGCATTASPTTATWSIDYSQQQAAQFAPTTYSSPSSSASAIMNWSGATKAMVGNGVVIPTGVTGATAGYYQIISAVAGTSISFDRNWNTTTVTTGGAAIGIGGALASYGMAASIATVGGMLVAVKYNASVYQATTASTNVSGGCVSGVAGVIYFGWNTQRWVGNNDTSLPTFQIGSGVATATLFGNASIYAVWNMILDGNSQTTSIGVRTKGIANNVLFKNFTAGGFLDNGSSITIPSLCQFCQFTGCSLVVPCQAAIADTCEGYSNTITPFTVGFAKDCLAYGNTGSTVDGFLNCTHMANCDGWDNGRDGSHYTTNSILYTANNCIMEDNVGNGFNVTITASTLFLQTCATYAGANSQVRSATSGFYIQDVNPQSQTSGSYFTNAAGGVFQLNATGGQGATLKAIGYPATFPAGLTNNYADVGAAQSQNTGGTSSILVPIQMDAP
jgi:hypothetical protein